MCNDSIENSSRTDKTPERKGTSQRVFFTSDLHFSHISILYFHPERLEQSGLSKEFLEENKALAIRQYDEWLVGRWNSTIKKRDSIYILGDLCLANKENTERLLNRLNGKKYLVRGNHDKSCNGLERYFEGVWDIKEAKFTNNQYKFISPDEPFCLEMCHYPLLTWNRKTHGSLSIHGHVHGYLDGYNTESGELRVDVGIDSALGKKCGGFVPLELLYEYFTDMRDRAGCKTFLEYQEMLYKKKGYRD